MSATSPLSVPEWNELQAVPLKKVWHWLGLFESTEYCRRAIAEHAKRQGRTRTPSAEQGRDLAACVKQGRGYFEAADSADVLVAPLLLYYGVLSLAKGVIIARGAQAGLHTMKHSHGLTVGALTFQNVGKAKLTDDVLALQATIDSSGTFFEYAQALAIPASCRMLDEDTNSFVTLTQQVASIGALPTTSMSLDDLMSRQPALRNLYHHSVDRLPRNYLVAASVNYKVSPAAYTYRLFPDAAVSGFPTPLETVFTAFSGKPWRKENAKRFGAPFDRDCDTVTVSDQLPLLPLASSLGVGHATASEGAYVVAPFAFGIMSEGLQLYLISYLLGMLVRYYATIWMRIQTAGTGDAIMPLLRGAVDLVRDRFPSIALAGLTSYVHELSFSTY